MLAVNIHEAKTHLSRLVEDAAHGKPFIIAKAGKPMVKVIPFMADNQGPERRLGFMVGPKALITEARALRRLMVRHAPNNNQRAAALFLSLGHHDTLIRRLHKAYRTRWEVMGKALNDHMHLTARSPSFGGTAYWV